MGHHGDAILLPFHIIRLGFHGLRLAVHLAEPVAQIVSQTSGAVVNTANWVVNGPVPLPNSPGERILNICQAHISVEDCFEICRQARILDTNLSSRFESQIKFRVSVQNDTHVDNKRVERSYETKTFEVVIWETGLGPRREKHIIFSFAMSERLDSPMSEDDFEALMLVVFEGESSNLMAEEIMTQLANQNPTCSFAGMYTRINDTDPDLLLTRNWDFENGQMNIWINSKVRQTQTQFRMPGGWLFA